MPFAAHLDLFSHFAESLCDRMQKTLWCWRPRLSCYIRALSTVRVGAWVLIFGPSNIIEVRKKRCYSTRTVSCCYSVALRKVKDPRRYVVLRKTVCPLPDFFIFGVWVTLKCFRSHNFWYWTTITWMNEKCSFANWLCRPWQCSNWQWVFPITQDEFWHSSL